MEINNTYMLKIGKYKCLQVTEDKILGDLDEIQ